MNKYKILRVGGHVEVLRGGDFFCSADTVEEALKEIQNQDERACGMETASAFIGRLAS
jgi:hypothetical protein